MDYCDLTQLHIETTILPCVMEMDNLIAMAFDIVWSVSDHWESMVPRQDLAGCGY